MAENGIFVISLDFELFWGVRDKRKKEDYEENILGVRIVIPRLLELFDKYKTNVTFAIVGFIFAKDKKELINYSPDFKPSYANKNLSPYFDYLLSLDDSSETVQFHFAPELIKLIKNKPQHEIATHTFSHYYCREEGQTAEEFTHDLNAAIKIAENFNVVFESIVFPRNQCNEEYLSICLKNGIKSYRGEAFTWYDKLKFLHKFTQIFRAFRLIDCYFNISGYNTYQIGEISQTIPFNIPGSRFLRPYSKNYILERLKINRILRSMTFAAKNNLVYHLWWHPHNFGKNIEANLEMLSKILCHYNYLNTKYHFKSMNMKEISKRLENLFIVNKF